MCWSSLNFVLWVYGSFLRSEAELSRETAAEERRAAAARPRGRGGAEEEDLTATGTFSVSWRLKQAKRS